MGARKVGMRTARLMRGEYAGIRVEDEYDADFKITNFYELDGILGIRLLPELKSYYDRLGDNERVEDLYDSDLPSKRFFYRRRTKDILRAMSPANPPLLEIGSGTGYMGAYLSKIGRTVLVDISKGFLKTSQKVIDSLGDQTNADYVLADARMLPFVDGSFGTISCSEVLEHLTSPVMGIREVRRLIARGGRAIITMPSAYSFAERERKARFSREGRFNDHISLLTPSTLGRVLREQGLEVLSESSTFFYPPIMTPRLLNKYPKLLRLLTIQRLIGKIPFLRYLSWTIIYCVGRR